MESASAVESSGRYPASRRSHVRAHLRTYAAALTDDDAWPCVLCACSPPISLLLALSLFLSLCVFAAWTDSRHGGIGRNRKWSWTRWPQVIRPVAAISFEIEDRAIIAYALEIARATDGFFPFNS